MVLAGCDGAGSAKSAPVPAEQRDTSEGASRTAPPAPPSVPVAEELAGLARQHLKGMVPVRSQWTGRLAEGEHDDAQIVLTPDRCYRVLAKGDMADLDLLLYDSNNVLAQQDTAQDSAPLIGVVPALCPDRAGLYRLRVRAHRGEGGYVAQLFATD